MEQKNTFLLFMWCCKCGRKGQELWCVVWAGERKVFHCVLQCLPRANTGGFVDLAGISSFVVFLIEKPCCSAADTAFRFLMHGVWFPFSSLSERAGRRGHRAAGWAILLSSPFCCTTNWWVTYHEFIVVKIMLLQHKNNVVLHWLGLCPVAERGLVLSSG